MQPAVDRPAGILEAVFGGRDRRDFMISEARKGDEAIAPRGNALGRNFPSEIVEEQFAARKGQRLAREIEHRRDEAVGRQAPARFLRVGVDMLGEGAAWALRADLGLDPRNCKGSNARAGAELRQSAHHRVAKSRLDGTERSLVNPQSAVRRIMTLLRRTAELCELHRSRVGPDVRVERSEELVVQEVLDDDELGSQRYA